MTFSRPRMILRCEVIVGVVSPVCPRVLSSSATTGRARFQVARSSWGEQPGVFIVSGQRHAFTPSPVAHRRTCPGCGPWASKSCRRRARWRVARTCRAALPDRRSASARCLVALANSPSSELQEPAGYDPGFEPIPNGRRGHLFRRQQPSPGRSRRRAARRKPSFAKFTSSLCETPAPGRRDVVSRRRQLPIRTDLNSDTPWSATTTDSRCRAVIADNPRPAG